MGKVNRTSWERILNFLKSQRNRVQVNQRSQRRILILPKKRHTNHMKVNWKSLLMVLLNFLKCQRNGMGASHRRRQDSQLSEKEASDLYEGELDEVSGKSGFSEEPEESDELKVFLAR